MERVFLLEDLGVAIVVKPQRLKIGLETTTALVASQTTHAGRNPHKGAVRAAVPEGVREVSRLSPLL